MQRFRLSEWVLGGFLALAAALVGCSGARDGNEKQLAALETSVSRLRAENAALNERLEDLAVAVRGVQQAGGESAPPRVHPRSDAPDLAVVRLAPGVVEEGDAEGPRLVVRAHGGAGSVSNTSDSAKRAQPFASKP